MPLGTLLGLLYLVTYLTFGVLGLQREARERRLPRWALLAMLVTFPLTALGAFAYLAELDSPGLSLAWRGVFLLIVASNGAEASLAYQALLREHEAAGEEAETRRASVLAVALSYLLLELPAVVMNFRFAFP
jgi:hypothetical protein